MTAIKCTEDVLAAAEINNNFILEFHTRIRKEKPRNVFYSGLTTSALLSMMWDSFADKKSKQATLVRKFLDMDGSKEKQITPGFSEILRSYKNLVPGPNDSTMKMVNKVYTNLEHGAVTDEFKEKLNEYDCLHESIPCIRGANMAEKINDDFGTYTNDKVKDIVTSEQIDADAKIMLVSSVSFRGVWEVPFKASLTEVMDFHCSNGRTVKVNMMKKKRASGFSYTNFAAARAHACAMYFEGFRYCMIVVRPKNRGDYTRTEAQMLKELKPDVLIAHFKRYHRKSRRGDGGLLVNVSMPRFKIRSQTLIHVPLMKMPNQPFGSGDDKPRYGDIFQTAHGTSAKITHIIQKCDIEIDETGAPQGIAVPSLLPARPLWKSRPKCVKMILDRSFYFVLYDYTNNCLIAAGVVDNPLEEGS